MTITEFLTARLDEAEALWRQADAEGLLLEVPGAPVVWADEMAPRQFLADIAAKRVIVALDETVPVQIEDDRDEGRNDMLWDVLCALAQPYAEHPDFDPAWRA